MVWLETPIGRPSHGPLPMTPSLPERPSYNRPGQPASSAVPKPCARSSKANAFPRSLPPSPCPLPPAASGSRAWPTTARRVEASGRALVDRPQAPARWPRTASAALSTPPGRLAPSLRHGVAAHWLQCSPTTPGARWAVRASAARANKGRTLLPAHRAARSPPGRPRLGRCRPRCPGVPGSSGRDHGALCRRHAPGALCPAPRGLVAPSPARAPPHPPSASESEHTRRLAQTPRVGPRALWEPSPQRWVAPWHGDGPGGDRPSLLSHRAAL